MPKVELRARYRLPSKSLVEVIRISNGTATCRYIAANGEVHRKRGEVTFELDWLAIYAQRQETLQ